MNDKKTKPQNEIDFLNCNFIIVIIYDFIWPSMLVCFQIPMNEKTQMMQVEVKPDKPAVAGGKLNMPAKRVCGKELKGAPFISKPEIILFKVPVYRFIKTSLLQGQN